MSTPSSRFLEIVKRYGIRLHDVGSSEIGLPRKACLAAIDALTDPRTVILGGDVWRLTERGSEPAYANWHCEPTDGEQVADYAIRSRQVAREYVSSYPDEDDGTTIYSLVMGRR